MLRKKLLSYAFITISCFILTGMIVGCELSSLEERDCVVMIGDSIFALSGEITDFLEDESGQKYRTYYMSGAQMNGGVNDIESQYDKAIRAGSIRTIIMDGGGNDFFFGNQTDLDGIAEEIRAAWIRILDKAGRDGVENIVVLGYYDTITTPEGGELSEVETAQGLIYAAEQRGMKLVYIDPDTNTWFSSKRPGQYTRDTIHPTTAAARVLAEMIWDAMVSNNIEQGYGCP